MAWYVAGVQLLSTLTLFASLQKWTPISEVHGVRGDWRYVNESALKRFYITGNWDDPFEENDSEPEFESSTNDYPKADHGITEKMWAASTTPVSAELHVLCSEDGFRFTVPLDSLKEVKVLGPTSLLSVMEAQRMCGYVMPQLNTVVIPYSGCHVKLQNAQYTVQLIYINTVGQADMVTASCTNSPRLDFKVQQPSYKHLPFPTCPMIPPVSTPHPVTMAYPPVSTPHPVTMAYPSVTSPTTTQNCMIPREQQLTCGPTGISSTDCLKMGCCTDSEWTTRRCYYPLDVCTRDKEFVFAVHYDSASVPVDPTRLIMPGNPSCTPVISNAKCAIFKFSVTDCGTRTYVVGETIIYLAEVQTVVHALNLKYGVISRSNPVRFLVECRYPKSYSGDGQSIVSVGYMVKIPSFPTSSVLATGRYGVELLIAEDGTYSKYLPYCHQPLWQILGKPVYLELRLRSAVTTAVLLVNYCLAYPRSASNALVLVYEGCDNPYDPDVAVLQVIDHPTDQYRRRFMVKAFQFMDLQTRKYLDEEIYFMCSTDVCMPQEKTCVQKCFDGKVL